MIIEDQGMGGLGDIWGDITGALNPIAAAQHALDVARNVQNQVATAIGVQDPLFNEIVRVAQNGLNDTQSAYDAASRGLTAVMRPLEDVILRNRNLADAINESSIASMTLDPALSIVVHDIANRTGQSADDVAHAGRNIAVVVVIVWFAWELIVAGGAEGAAAGGGVAAGGGAAAGGGVAAGGGAAAAGGGAAAGGIWASLGTSIAGGVVQGVLNPASSPVSSPSPITQLSPVTTAPPTATPSPTTQSGGVTAGKVLPFVLGGAAILAATML